jgi:excisionase family DNA binding protein
MEATAMLHESCEGYGSVPAGAKFLNISPRTMWELVRQGKVPSYRIGKRLVRVSFRDLDELMAQNKLAEMAECAQS